MAKRRVSPLTRERARERMLALPVEERQRRAQLMQEGKRRKRSPEALKELTDRIDSLGEEFKDLPTGEPRRLEIIHELRPLVEREYKLREALDA